MKKRNKAPNTCKTTCIDEARMLKPVLHIFILLMAAAPASSVFSHSRSDEFEASLGKFVLNRAQDSVRIDSFHFNFNFNFSKVAQRGRFIVALSGGSLPAILARGIGMCIHQLILKSFAENRDQNQHALEPMGSVFRGRAICSSRSPRK